ncbi:MAG: Uma2 family endonuclease [Microscillaceae bacterium]|jgi:Uma2 family endonuclease|nr:Uma2 family endonuclease [Microscillaceae bacterium]
MENVIEISTYELERGKPMPSLNHSILQSNLIFELKSNYRNKYTIASELSLEMPQKPDTVPDISIFPILTIDYLHDQTSMRQMPLAVLEIVSPSQANDEILAKFERYFAAGVKSCWLVIPVLKNIYVFSDIQSYQIFGSKDTLNDPTLQISLDLTKIFQ